MQDTTIQPQGNQTIEDPQTQTLLKALMEVHNTMDDLESRVTDLEDQLNVVRPEGPPPQ